MKYSRVYMESIGYELPPVTVTSSDLESRLQPMYDALHLHQGQLESLTGITERRWWEPGYSLSDGAVAAAHKAIEQSNVQVSDIETIIYTGVCREHFEPATACIVAAKLGIRENAHIYDLSNACLGAFNGMIDIANQIELKQIRAGIVVSCETSRDIVETMIQHMLNNHRMEIFTQSLATLTGGSGAVAVLITDGSFDNPQTHRLIGAVTQSAPQHHELCHWGIGMSPVALGQLMFSPEKMLDIIDQIADPSTLSSVIRSMMTSEKIPSALVNIMPTEKLPKVVTEFMSTDSVGVLTHGVKLGVKTWGMFLDKMSWGKDQVDKVICHQVGAEHRNIILKKLGIDTAKDFNTYSYLGNIGTVSIPLTAAIAQQRNFLKPNDRVSFLGIGSGLNCIMLGWEW